MSMIPARDPIRIGMTKEELLRSWGEPWNAIKTVTSWGTDEQLFYSGVPQTIYVYLENGVVTAYQE